MAKRVDGGLSTSYIEDKLFFIYIDEAYAQTLLAYSAFMLLAVILVFLFSPSHQQDPGASKRWERVSERFSHPTLLMIVALVTVAKLAVVAILVRANGDTSLYLATRMVRGETASYIRVYQYLNIISSYSLAAGLSLWLAFPRARQARSRLRASLWVAYLALGLEVLAENALLGNRAVPLLVAGAVAVAWIRWRLIPAARTERGPLITRFIMLCFLGLLAVGLIGVSRGGNLSSPTAVLQSLVENAARPEYILESIQSSNEKLSAHMALYGVIREDPQLSPLASSSYDAYAQLVHAPEDQGFTIHYVAAWWVRSGSVGVLLAALTYALVIVGLHRLSQANRRWWTAAFALPAATLPAIGVPFIMLRSGPESMRGSSSSSSSFLDSYACCRSTWAPIDGQHLSSRHHPSRLGGPLHDRPGNDRRRARLEFHSTRVEVRPRRCGHRGLAGRCRQPQSYLGDVRGNRRHPTPHLGQPLGQDRRNPALPGRPPGPRAIPGDPRPVGGSGAKGRRRRNGGHGQVLGNPQDHRR